MAKSIRAYASSIGLVLRAPRSRSLCTGAVRRQFTCASQAIAEVGCGLPPAGSSVTARAAISFLGIFTGATSAIWPDESGWKIATLIGFPVFGTLQRCRVRAEGMEG